MNANATPATDAPVRRPAPREMTKILNDCRDLAVHRLLLSFSSVLDRVSDVLMDRASKTDIRDEQQMFLDARQALKTERANLMADFEKKLRRTIDDRVAGKEEVKADFSKIDSTMLTLVDTSSMDESVITGNIIRVVENLCHDELLSLNRGIGHLLGKPDLETPDNPLAPSTIVHAFSDALKNVKTENRIKFQILKELNQAPLSDINAIYADLNRHLTNLRMMPSGRGMPHRAADRGRPGAPGTPPQQPVPPASPEVDVMALFRRMASQGSFPMAGRAPQAPAPSQQQMPPGFPNFAGGAPPAAPGELPQIDYGAAMPPAQAVPSRTFAPMAPTPSGYIPGAPIMATPALHEGLTRLQAGQSGFDVEGAMVTFSGIPEGLHNVLRDLQESPLGQKANQLESMTIEMVAMLFDFVFETKDLPDGIKALLARLQIPVLKAAMLDGAFFAKKTHPARLLVNALAEAGLGWSPMMGNEDPLYRKIEKIVHGILDGFSNDLAIFDDLREELETFLAAEEKLAEANIATTAEEITRRDRQQIATNVARSEVERRIESYPIPNFLAQFLRTKWQSALEHSYQQDGEDSEVWSAGVTTLEDLVWSVQPKKTPEDRKHLVALLPSLLKRLSAGMQTQSWPQEERESFMANLVEAHAAAVKPSLSAVPSPTAAVAEQAKVQAEIAKASGDTVGAAKAEALAVAMTPAEPAAPEAEAEVLDDEYLEIARSLERGAWVEFEGEDGQLAFAKLAWVSPLRGTYLFTNRQGQKALSMTAEELAERFRADRARLVEAEPLIDRAFSSVLTQLNEKFGEETAAA